jgi:HD-GYP domain-containing protein (c-di-GMP phosphodiesterase class II)
MKSHLKLREFDFDDLEAAFDRVTKDYLAVKVRDFFPATALPCGIYYPAVRKSDKSVRLALLLKQSQIYEHDFHESLMSQEISEVYIRKEDEEAYNAYFVANLQKLLQSSHLATEKKTELLYDNAETIVKKAFRERPNRANIAMGEQLISSFTSHISTDHVSSHALLSLFSKDYMTFSHCVQVALLGMSLCRFMRWKPVEVADFGLGALFHDVGKNVIPDEILNKPGKLDADEFDMIKKHPLLGYQQIKDTQRMSKDQLTVVLHHHEARDGSGYPYRLKGDSIHKYARVARIVDVFDALTTKRPYKNAIATAKALKIMHEEMRETFDPAVFDAFVKFVQAERRTEDVIQGQRINIELGNEALIQVEGSSTRMKAVLIGMELAKYVVFRIRGLMTCGEGARADIRYARAGSIYGFQSDVIAFIQHPFPLLFLSYPKRVEMIEQRKEPRVDCSISAEIQIREVLFTGKIGDLSATGCRFCITLPEAETANSIRVNDEITLHTDFSGALGREQLLGRIQNTRFDQERGLLGILFLDMSADARNYIDTAVQRQTT